MPAKRHFHGFARQNRLRAGWLLQPSSFAVARMRPDGSRPAYPKCPYILFPAIQSAPRRCPSTGAHCGLDNAHVQRLSRPGAGFGMLGGLAAQRPSDICDSGIRVAF